MSDATCRCQFCLEFSGQPEAVYFDLAPAEPRDRTVWRDGHFRVIPPLGQFLEGSVMLVSERHVPSCAALSEAEAAELEGLILRTQQILTREYRAPLFFEHGPASATTKGTCCVDHAHVHAFPADVDVHRFLAERFSWSEVKNIADIAAAASDGGYLFLQQRGRRYVYGCEVIPSQLIRQVIATALGVPERWHWRSYLGLSEMRATFERLRAAQWSTE